jgi:hypothetical protein
MTSLDHKAAKEWAEKYQAIQGDSTVGNCMRCYIDSLEKLKQRRTLTLKLLDFPVNQPGYREIEQALREELKEE